MQRRWLVAGILVLLCAGLRAGEEPEGARDEKPQKIQDEAVPAALRPVLEKPVTVDFRGTPLGEVLKTLAEQAGVEFEPRGEIEVDMKMRLVLRNQPLSDVLAAVSARANIEVEYGLGIRIRSSTPRERLEKLVSLEADGIAFSELLRSMAGRGVNYVMPEDLLDLDAPLAIRVKDMPLRDVIQAAAHAAGLHCQISEAGIVSFGRGAEQARAQAQANQWRDLMERAREWRDRRVQPPRNRMDGGPDGDARPENREAPREEGREGNAPDGKRAEPRPNQEDDRIF